MLEELTASLIASQPEGDSLTTESPASSPEPGMPLVTTPRAGQHGIDQAAAFTPFQPMASVAYAGETLCCSAQGRKRPRTPVPDSEAVELDLLRPIHGTDDEGHNAQPPSADADASLLSQLEARLCIPLRAPLIRTPRLRRSRTPAKVLSVCRSGRLAAKTKASNPTVQA
jgi:hypothetical protein